MIATFNPAGRAQLPTVATQAVRVKLKFKRCQKNSTITFTNNSLMLLAFYTPTSNSPSSAGINFNSVINSDIVNDVNCIPEITNITPSSASAGTNTIITILGKNFRLLQNKGKIIMKDGNKASTQTIKLNAVDMVSWNNSEIKFKLSSIVKDSTGNSWFYGVPGSGTVRVLTNMGDTTPNQGNILTVTFAYSQHGPLISGQLKKIDGTLSNDGLPNPSKFVFRFDSASIGTDSAFRKCFTLALEKWVCLSGVNWTIGTDTSLNKSTTIRDGVNIVQYFTDNLDNTIAQTRTYTTPKCTTSTNPVYQTDEIDIIVNTKYSYFKNTDENADVPSGQHDLHQTLLHELGHGHNFYHINDEYALMYPFLGAGPRFSFNRILSLIDDPDLVSGANYAIDRFVNANTYHPGCGLINMTKILSLPACSGINSAGEFIPTNPTMVLYPNPANNYSVLKFETPVEDILIADMYTIDGRHINTIYNTTIPVGTTMVAIENLPSGVYFIRVNFQNQVSSIKLVVF